MQEVADARRIRNRILLNFELATQVTTSEEERRRLLHFVVVGGGPTGVEFGAELYDFLKKVYTCSGRKYSNKRSLLVLSLSKCTLHARILSV